MATKQEIIADIRAVYPNAGAITRSQVKRYIQDRKHRTKAEVVQNDFFDGLEPVRIGGSSKYLVIDVAAKLCRLQPGAS